VRSFSIQCKAAVGGRSRLFNHASEYKVFG
jgi:hypothetical protein